MVFPVLHILRFPDDDIFHVIAFCAHTSCTNFTSDMSDGGNFYMTSSLPSVWLSITSIPRFSCMVLVGLLFIPIPYDGAS